MTEIYEFEGFRVDVRRRLLTRAGQSVPLTPKAFDTLLVLVRSGGRLMTKDEIISEVWPDTFVEEGNLAQNIFLLRRALAEARGEHRFIVTVPGAGYLFVPQVRVPDAAVTPCASVDRSVGSLAVLPFTPLVAEGADESMGFGLADALTRRLTACRGVKVLPTYAALRLAGSPPDAQAGVEALLYGVYQTDCGRIRVSVQLVRTSDGMTVWAAKFDEESTDRFAIQDSISEQVAQELAPTFACTDRRHLSVVRDPHEQRLRRSS